MRSADSSTTAVAWRQGVQLVYTFFQRTSLRRKLPSHWAVDARVASGENSATAHAQNALDSPGEDAVRRRRLFEYMVYRILY